MIVLATREALNEVTAERVAELEAILNTPTPFGLARSRVRLLPEERRKPQL